MKRAVAAALLLGVALWWFLREPPGDPRLPPPVRKQVLNLQASSERSRQEAVRELLKEAPSPALALALAPSITDPAVNNAVREWFRNHADVSGDAIPILVAALDHESHGVRWEALYALENFGERAGPAIPALLRMLERPEERRMALAALEDVGPAARAAVDAILAEASGPDRWFALLSLDEPWFPLERALPVLLEMLTDPDPGVARVAVWSTLRRLARAPADCGAPAGLLRAASSTSLSELEGLLEDEDIRVRLCAVEALGDLVERTGTEVVLAPMARALKHRHVDVRRGAADHSAWLKDPGAAVPALAEALLDADLEVGPLAAATLGWLGPAGAPALGRAIESRLHMVEPGLGALGRIGPPAVDTLVKLLGSESPDVRTRAAELLSRTLFESGAAEAPPLTPQLAAALRDDTFVLKALTSGALERWGEEAQPAVAALARIATGEGYGGDRVKALQLLESFGPGAVEAVPTLSNYLGLVDGSLTVEIGRALGAVGPAAHEAIPVLTKVAETSPYPTFRCVALWALGRIGASDVLRRALADPDPMVRLAAAAGLPDADALPTLERLLEHPDYMVRRATIGLARPGLRPGILRRLSSKGPDERVECLKALSAMGVREELPRVAQALSDSSEEVRKEAIKAVEKLSPDPDHAARLLARFLDEPDRLVQVEGLQALGRVGSPEAIGLLRRATALEGSLGRRTAAEQLGGLGPAAKSALPELARLLKDEDTYVQSAALAAIGKIGPAGRRVVEAIVARFAADGSSEASALIASFTPEARDAVPSLIPLLSNRNPWHREVAARGLAGIGPAASPALPALARAALECENDPQRDALISALKAIGADAVPALRTLVPQARPFMRYDAAALLVRLDPEDADAMKVLHEGLGGADRRTAVRALRLTPAGVPMLIEALKDPSPRIVEEAVEALRKLPPTAAVQEALRKIESP